MIGEDQRADEVAVEPGQHDVADQRRAGRDHAGAHGGEIDPGAGRELEVLADAAVEDEALGQIVGIGEFQRVADLVEALLVEGLARSFPASLPIAGRDVGALEAQFELVAIGHELDLHARRRQADHGPARSTGQVVVKAKGAVSVEP